MKDPDSEQKLTREQIDREFEEMGLDVEYQRLMVEMEAEGAQAGCELLRRLYLRELRDGCTYDASG